MDLPPALPHGALSEVFPDVFLVTGTSTPRFLDVDWRYSRNMVVLRRGGELTLVNTVRLFEDGLAALERLGTVAHVVRLGAFHGRDDAFYVRRYRARFWTLPGITDERGLTADVALTPGGPLPLPGCRLFAFETTQVPEGALLLERDGGILVTCDSVQNWEAPDEYFDEASAERMAGLGFFGAANIGPGWRQGAQPRLADFTRLLSWPFAHLLSAHGRPLLHQAHARLARTVARAGLA